MEKEYIVTFFTHNGALSYEAILQEQNLQGTLFPVPRELSAHCGIALAIKTDKKELPILDDVDEIYLHQNNQYLSIYSSNS